MLPWKEPIAQEFLAVDIVLEIVLSVQDPVVLERVNLMADHCSCLTLGTQKSKGNTSSVQTCDTSEGDFVTR